MRLGRWLAAIGILTVLGMAKVAERTAMRLSAYGLGRATVRTHEMENDTERLRTQVIRLQSPAQLVHIMRDRKLDMVAWSLSAPSASASPAAGTRAQSPARPSAATTLASAATASGNPRASEGR